MPQPKPAAAAAQGNRRKSIFTAGMAHASASQTAQALELERLEQAITMKLQNIDRSFAKSHKIVNEKLIPIVKRHHAETNKVWRGVNFWKRFLESSANVELRGYEEAVETEMSDQSMEKGDSEGAGSSHDLNEQMSPVKVVTGGTTHDLADSSIQQRYQEHFKGSSKSGAAHGENPIMPQVGNNYPGFDTSDSILPPVLTTNLTNTNNGTVTTPSIVRQGLEQQSRHYVMHNNGDTNYKVEVSPRKRKHGYEPAVNSLTPRKPASKKSKSAIAQRFDSSPFEIETPKLQSDIIFSPVKPRNTSPRKQQDDENLTQRFPHTPRYGAGGALLQTPGQVALVAKRYSQNFDIEVNEKGLTTANLMEDSEDPLNMSPPVTLKFATAVTEDNVRRTPAREAAQKIVKDLLQNVSGINDSTEFEDALTSVQNNATTTTAAAAAAQAQPNSELEDFDAFLDKPQKKTDAQDWSED